MFTFFKLVQRGKGKKDPKAYPLGSLLFSAPIEGILFRQLRVGCY